MSSEYRSYGDGVLAFPGANPSSSYYLNYNQNGYYPTNPEFNSSYSPSSIMEDTKQPIPYNPTSFIDHPELGHMLPPGNPLPSPHYLPPNTPTSGHFNVPSVAPSSAVASPMHSNFDFHRNMDHRGSSRQGYSHPPPHYQDQQLQARHDDFRSNYPPEASIGPMNGNNASAAGANQGSSELRGRAENWTFEETRTFVRLLMEHANEFQNIRRHPGLWGMLANRMVQNGFPRTIEKCKNRWKVLVAKYKRCHSEMQRQQNSKFQSSSGKNLLILNDPSANPNSPQGFEFFYQMETLLKPNYHISSDGVQRRFRTNPATAADTPTLSGSETPVARGTKGNKPTELKLEGSSTQDLSQDHPFQAPSSRMGSVAPMGFYNNIPYSTPYGQAPPYAQMQHSQQPQQGYSSMLPSPTGPAPYPYSSQY